MTTVHIVEKFNTSLGTIVTTDDKETFKIGDQITCDDGSVYVIKGIQMPTRPIDKDTVALIVN